MNITQSLVATSLCLSAILTATATSNLSPNYQDDEKISKDEPRLDGSVEHELADDMKKTKKCMKCTKKC